MDCDNFYLRKLWSRCRFSRCSWGRRPCWRCRWRRRRRACRRPRRPLWAPRGASRRPRGRSATPWPRTPRSRPTPRRPSSDVSVRKPGSEKIMRTRAWIINWRSLRLAAGLAGRRKRRWEVAARYCVTLLSARLIFGQQSTRNNQPCQESASGITDLWTFAWVAHATASPYYVYVLDSRFCMLKWWNKAGFCATMRIWGKRCCTWQIFKFKY